MEDPNQKPIAEERKPQINSIHPSGLNRAQRRHGDKHDRRAARAEMEKLKNIAVKEFEPLDVSGLEYEDGVTKPVRDPSWPWMLEEVTQRLNDNKIIAHKMTGMSTRTVSNIRIHYAKPEDHLLFRRGKPIALEFKDAVTTMKLTRQNRNEKTPVIATSAEQAIEALESEK